MHRYTYLIMVASLMVLSDAAKADDACNAVFGDYPEAGLCLAYCSMTCDPLTDAKATEAACRNVATTLSSFLSGKKRGDVTSEETDLVVDRLDDAFCLGFCNSDGEIPPCDG